MCICHWLSQVTETQLHAGKIVVPQNSGQDINKRGSRDVDGPWAFQILVSWNKTITLTKLLLSFCGWNYHSITSLLTIQGRWRPENSVLSSWALSTMQQLMRFLGLWNIHKPSHGFHSAFGYLHCQALTEVGAPRWNDYDVPKEFNFASDVLDYWTRMEKVRSHLWWEVRTGMASLTSSCSY